MKNNIIAIIPARGGSKGVPNKNIKILNGKPLITYSIEACKKAKYISDVYVSTDSKEIANISMKCGAKIIELPKSLTGDKSSSESAIKYTIKNIEKLGIDLDLVVFLQATSPIREKKDLDLAIEKFFKEKADSLFSAQRSYFNIWEERRNNLVSITYDHKNRARRQDRPVQWHENGSFYIFKKKNFLRTNNRLSGRVSVFEIPYKNSFEIDDPFDFYLIEKIIKYKGKR